MRKFTSAMGLFDSGCQYRIPLLLVDVSGDGTSLVLPPVAINSTSRADVQERKSAVVLRRWQRFGRTREDPARAVAPRQGRSVRSCCADVGVCGSSSPRSSLVALSSPHRADTEDVAVGAPFHQEEVVFASTFTQIWPAKKRLEGSDTVNLGGQSRGLDWTN